MDQPAISHLPHGYLILFFAVLVEQAGLPIPAAPMILVMGALAGSGQSSLLLTILTAVVASLIGDWIWFELGRRQGRSVVRGLCRISGDPDHCVYRTETAFSNFGSRTLLFAKFVPGLSTVAPPLAAMLGMSRLSFAIWDGMGTLIWATVFSAAGVLFRAHLGLVMSVVAQFGTVSAFAITAGFVVAVLWMRIQPRQLLERVFGQPWHPNRGGLRRDDSIRTRRNFLLGRSEPSFQGADPSDLEGQSETLPQKVGYGKLTGTAALCCVVPIRHSAGSSPSK